VPTGIKIFNWLATIWGGKVRFATPMMFCVAFLFSVPDCRAYRHHAFRSAVRLATGNSYFVMAHFHYVLVGAILFASLRPSITGTRRSPAA
jgi:cytochrome c oxidase subunit 1